MATESPLFAVLKPHPLSLSKGKGGAHLDADASKEAFKSHPARSRRGVYILTSSGYGGKLTPWYVGRATKTFEQEIFTTDKINKYNLAVTKFGCKRLVIQFLCLPTVQGKPNIAAIKKLEAYLIAQCSLINGDLLNKQGTKQYVLRVAGVMNSGQGKPSAAASAVRAMLE